MTARNFPMSLAWAVTIHKAQGSTLDKIWVDIRRLWEPGQAYVALSRVTDPDELWVEGWDARSIFTDPAVRAFTKAISAIPESRNPAPMAPEPAKPENSGASSSGRRSHRSRSRSEKKSRPAHRPRGCRNARASRPLLFSRRLKFLSVLLRIFSAFRRPRRRLLPHRFD